MGLFRQPRAACDHQQAPWYLTGPDAYTGTCLCRVVRRDELLGRVLYVRRQAGGDGDRGGPSGQRGPLTPPRARWASVPGLECAPVYARALPGLWAPGLPPAPPPPLRPHGGCHPAGVYPGTERGCEYLSVMTFLVNPKNS